MAVKPVSVTQLNRYIKQQLALDPILSNVPVSGEISGLTKHSTGHWYFSLKDENSKINCFLARDKVSKLRYDIQEGMQVVCWGAVSVFERGGYYSLQIREIELEGEGELQKAFENLKKKLAEEGLFDEAHKRPMPAFPRKIGVITSPTGAAVRDIITTIKRRSNLVDILLYPCIVQGPDAAESICEGIRALNEQFSELDLLIVGRGGGSIEDLWAFNEESVARAIYASNIPVISAVGHEVDYVISDFVADLRGATPTAAAELAVPPTDWISEKIESFSPEKMYNLLRQRTDNTEMKIKHMLEIISSSTDSYIAGLSHRIQMLKLDVDGMNPMLQLKKGYAIARGEDGKWINSAEDVNEGDKIRIILQDGSINCIAEGKE